MERPNVWTRLLRTAAGEPWPRDDESDERDLTPAERMDLVWTLSVRAFGFAGMADADGRLRRDVVHIERRRR